MRTLTIMITIAALACLLAGCGGDDDASACGPSNCAGCCTADGLCVSGDAKDQCGTGGGACAACQSGTCSAGTCVAGCNATNCPGCCQGEQCMPGTVPSACGKGGASCVICQSGELCSSGACAPVTSCDTTTCPSGCCQGGQCMPGITDAACGSGGVACVACQVPAQSCVNQSCTSGPTCDASTCPDGCCDSQAQCLPGNLDTACGKGGAACDACAAGNTCVNNACSSPAGCGPCAGCCDGQSCVAGTADTACGGGGVACQACGSFAACTNNACAVKPDSTWDVTAVDGEIAKPPLGRVWDPNAIPGFQEPDVYVELTAGGQTGQTSGDDNTYTPSWNKVVLSGVKAQDLMQSLAIKVWDEELIPPHELMGQCTVQIAEAELIAGARAVTACGNPDITKINLTFTAK